MTCFGRDNSVVRFAGSRWLGSEWLLVVVGILLRLKHLLENRPLWLDEAYVAVSLIGRSYSEILSNYEIFPEFARAPSVFLVIEKLMVGLFGNSEISLRLFPFLCSITALILFTVVFRKILSRPAFLIALAFFALAEPLVYYSAELKQYSGDLVCAIVLFALARNYLQNGLRIKDGVILALAGAGILWLSNAMVFVLAGIGCVGWLGKPWQKGRTASLLCISAGIIWLISFAGLYFSSLRFMVGKVSITNTWKSGLCSYPVFSTESLRWLWEVTALSFSDPAGLKWWGLLLPCFILGAIILWRKEREALLLLVLPLLFVLLAALLGKYPFYKRVILFLTPVYYVLISTGIVSITGWFPKYLKKWVLLFLVVLVFFQPVADAANNYFHSRSKTDNRGIMDFVAEYYKPGDFIYLSTSAQPPFWYYAQRSGLTRKFAQPVIGSVEGRLISGFKLATFALDPQEMNGRQFLLYKYDYNIFNSEGMFRANFSADRKNGGIGIVPLDQAFRYPVTRRTWLILSAPGPEEAGSNSFILGSFDKTSTRLLTYEGLNAGAYLFDIK
ncbi:MAG: glycosyltransferase family 39 protein [Candidatus Omnitrophica bacterium]|nr:glycosyltransferase family 39 protein [Candidatus Omnitrophota bacterium]